MNSSVETLVSILERENVEWELYWEAGRGGSFRIERERLERSQRKFYSGMGLRVGYNGRLGFSYITGLNHDRKTLEEFVKRAVKLARVSEILFRGFPAPSKVPRVDGLYDRRIEDIPFEEAHSLAEEFAGKMRELKGDSLTLSGSLALGVNSYGVANSSGVFLEGRSTGMSVSAYAVVEGTRPGTGYHYQSYRSLQPLEELGRSIALAREEALLSSAAERLEPFSGELVLEPSAFQSLLGIFLENLYGDSVYFGRSRFSGTGEEVAGEAVTLVDDPTLPGLPGSYPFDGEGTPGRRTVLIEKGLLRNFLLDHTYGSFLGMESTSNAVRDFRTVPHIGTSNLVVEPGKERLEDYEGVVVRRVFGEHTANPVSGDFSLTVELGYVIKNGELRPFRDNMLTGNVFEVLRSVSSVGRESVREGSFISPRVLTVGRIV
ncbi:putative modulator of DNA gyrase, PmbA/TldD protein-like protein 2 [Thermococcus cleftensis]|uniref:Modulator of DNA gyrase, PmbA/TldD protein-like protein 2 n=1 Tax=Thermococcus cleftensis (strain DSM 27260 / KACC 17922 / CL1) TaxID=163003 RepID=I3ZUT8_THECF|nr:TldD/PmbA family protein [Thermococcus cleftensis]AFL95472.1 putative modulator of DNA gyrase, PmbA/TldD protein-like protein 2 [Thermococcus cleftensis]